MKVIFITACLLVILSSQAKITKKMRNASDRERELSDSGSGGAEQILDANDSTAIDNAAARMASLVDRVNRLKAKLQRELQTTVSYLRYHFNQRDVFDKRVMMRHLSQLSSAPAANRKLMDEVEDRKTVDQPMLKKYGMISSEVKEENFEAIKVPQDNEDKTLNQTETDNKK